MNAKKQNSALIKRLDKMMSLYVRARDGQRCITCPSRTQLTCSHFFRRGMMSVRWDARNCACQCMLCNNKHDHDRQPYEEWFIAKYGESERAQLEKLSRDFSHYKLADLLSVEKELQELLRTV